MNKFINRDWVKIEKSKDKLMKISESYNIILKKAHLEDVKEKSINHTNEKNLLINQVYRFQIILNPNRPMRKTIHWKIQYQCYWDIIIINLLNVSLKKIKLYSKTQTNIIEYIISPIIINIKINLIKRKPKKIKVKRELLVEWMNLEWKIMKNGCKK